MAAYLALTRIYLRLTLRDRAALFFTYFMPLLFFFMFGQMMHAERGTSVLMVNMVLTIGILGSGLFGAGMRATTDRETNVLRRFKVAPISPAPLLVASMVVGLLNYVPVFAVILLLAKWLYGMPIPGNLISLTVFVLVGVLAFRAIGLMASSVANSAQEAQILIQSLYMPMLFLSGATIPVTLMPEWVQTLAQFLPATHLFSGMQAIMGSGESLAHNLPAFTALLITIAVGMFISIKLFRWEKNEKLRAAAKLWVLVVLAPFVLMGVWQTYSKSNIAKNKVFDRELSRRVAYLTRNVRIFTGDGTVIENGAVLTRDGTIVQVYTSEPPTAKQLRATEIEGAGKTLLPGLIDVQVHLAAPGGFYENPRDYNITDSIKHALAAYLYSAVTAVGSVGDPRALVLAESEKIRLGTQLGAEVFVVGTDSVPRGAVYDPALMALEGLAALREGKTDPIDRSLVQQVGPAKLIAGTRKYLQTSAKAGTPLNLDVANSNLLEAYRRGMTLVTGSNAGNPLTFHGPTVQREIELWVQAGIPPAVALQAATGNAARLLGAGDRIGLIKKGYEATFFLVDGDPLKDISATERISTLLFKGERIHRPDLFDQD